MAHQIFFELLLLFGSSLIAVLLFRKLRLPVIVAYLAVGVVLGGALKLVDPSDPAISVMGELGLVFLLFALGLEFSMAKMMALRRLVFGLGLSQVILTALLFFALARWAAMDTTTAAVVALALTFSSTALVSRELTERGLLHQRVGQMAMGTLIFQDLVAVPLLAVIPQLQHGVSMDWPTLLMATAKAAMAFALLVWVGQRWLPKWLGYLLKNRSDEMLVLGVLTVVLGAASVTSLAGLSLSLGAFLGGVMLGESPYRIVIAAELRPFRDVLLGVFFISIGTQVDPYIALSNALPIGLLVVLLMLVKPAIVWLVTRPLGESAKSGALAGLHLWQAGEFGLVMLALALQENLLTPVQSSVIVSAGVISMMVSPWFVEWGAARLHAWCSGDASEPPDPVLAHMDKDADLRDHIIIAGFGRVGQIIYRYAKRFGYFPMAIDRDPVRVQEARAGGETIVYGDARSRDVLHSLHIEHAKMLIISFDEPSDAMEAIHQARALHPRINILCRTRDDAHLAALLQAGATEVVPEILEGAMMLVAHVLLLAGEPLPRVLRSLQETRDSRYGLLHGFYHGETSDIEETDTQQLQKLHAITLHEGSAAVGKALGDVLPATGQIEVLRISRTGRLPMRPLPDILLEPGDTLMVKGTSLAIEETEDRLHRG
jgi:CPA2 family monovalent cation:H+ antiporter-2